MTDWIASVIRRAYARGGTARFGTQVVADALSWIVAVLAAGWVRYEFDLDDPAWMALGALGICCAALQIGFGMLFVLYQGRYSYGSFDEVRALVLATVCTAAIAAVVTILFGTVLFLPRSVVIIAAPVALVLMACVRYAKRLILERHFKPAEASVRTLIYGAGYFGSEVTRRMRRMEESPFDVVGLIDDDPAKQHVWHSRVRVLGTGRDLARVVEETRAEQVVVAIARADSEMLTRIADDVEGLGVRVLVMPTLHQLLRRNFALGDLRELAIEDLVGRRPVDTDVATVAGYLRDKRVLVTGAGGSIGSELCRQIAEFDPAELIMLDRDETGLQSAQISISGHGLLDTNDVVLADIRDAETMRALLAERRPQVVFHAAALKHLPMLEQYPGEAWQTNVLGTLNVLEAAFAADVETFVNISTDKAANPTSVLGHSKRVGERLTAAFSRRSAGRYLSVRFGNVLGSRGSMVPTFASIIDAGGPLTVTHPDITRYFMTVPEACQLVVQAGGIGRPGEVLILDMGEPVRILDVAKRMIRKSGKPIEIVFTGLRPHEKLHEELIGIGEHGDRPFHEKITHTAVEPIDPSTLDRSQWDAYWRDEHAKDAERADRQHAMLTGATAPVERVHVTRGSAR